MIMFPNAKLNLGLRVISKRSDGYHDIESVFVPTPWYDALELNENTKFKQGENPCNLTISGLNVGGDAGQNLVVKAYKLLSKIHSLPPVNVHLLKSIPIGAGLGGGSADGAFMLKLLNIFCNLEYSESELEVYAAELGSDCSFFIRNKPAMVSGRGDRLGWPEIKLQQLSVLMVYPGIHLPTIEAYSNLNIDNHSGSKSLLEIIHSPIEDWKENFQNDFEDYAFAKYQEIKLLKETIYQQGALYASMTGSGSAVFGLFDMEPNISWIPENYYWKLGNL